MLDGRALAFLMSSTLRTAFKILLSLAGLFIVTVALAVYLLGYSDFGLSEIMVHKDPARRYRVLVLRRFWWGMIPMGPGQGSDAPGVARLVDSQGNILQEVEVPMVQLAYDVEWSVSQVRLRGMLVEWPLPVE